MTDKEVSSAKRGKEGLKLPFKETLEPMQLARYEEKTNILDGADPYEQKNLSSDVKLLPGVTYPDTIHYLVSTPSPFTLDDLKCYKGLDQFICGWVSGLSTSIINGKHLVKAMVKLEHNIKNYVPG